MTTSNYIHGTESTEQERLSLLNRLHNERCLSALAIRPDERVLDCGSGLGQLACAMAQATGPGGRVVGVEREEAQLSVARARARDLGVDGILDLRQGDVLAPPLAEAEVGTFDVAHTRWVLEHLPEPDRLVEQMVRAVRPGGRVVLMDDDHSLLRTWPTCAEGEAVWTSYYETYAAIGNDPLVGRKLPTLLHEAGCEELEFRLVDYSACHGEPAFAPSVENIVEVVRGARRAVLEADAAWTGERFDAALDAFYAWARRPDATLIFAFCWAQGRRRR